MPTHLELGANEIVAANKVAAQGPTRVRRVPRAVDGEDDLVHPLAIGGGEGDERDELRIRDLERGSFDLKERRSGQNRARERGGRTFTMTSI